MLKILIADDNPEKIAEFLKLLEKEFGSVEMLPFDDTSIPSSDVVITESENGFNILKKVREIAPHIPVIMLTDTDDAEIVIKAMREGFDDVILKKRIDELPNAVKRAIEKRKREKELNEKIKKLNCLEKMLLGYDSEEDLKEIEEKGYFFGISEWKRKDGSAVLVNECTVPIKDEKGNTQYYLGVVEDITEFRNLIKNFKESEKKYRELWENANDLLYILDLEGNIIEANRAALELFKYDREDFDKVNLRDIIVGKYVETAFENLRKIIETGKPIHEPLELLCKTKDGKLVWLEVKSHPIMENGKVVAIQGIARDITERKETVELFKTLAEKSLVGIYLIQDGVFKYVNPKLAELWGCEVEEIVGRSPLEFIHPEDKDLVEKNLRLRIEGKIDAIKYRFKVIRKDGEVRINEVFGSQIFYRGKPAIIGMLIDVTEQKRYLKKLEEYKRFYENAQDLFFILDEKGRFLDINPKFAEIVGYDVNELIGKTSKKLAHPEDLERLREFFSAVKRGEIRRDEFRAITKDGEILWFEILEWPIFENGELVKFEGIAREITQRKKLEEKLKESEEKFRKIFENSPNIVAIIDSTGRFIEANPSLVKSLGVNPIGKTIFNVLPEEVAKRRFEYYKRALKEGKAIKFQDTANKRHFIHTVIPIELGGKKHLLLIASDVSELVRLNQLLRVTNNISKLIAHIRNKQILLKKVCEELTSLGDYLAVTINLFEEGELKPVVAAGASQEFLDKIKNCKLLRELKQKECDKLCPECEIKDEIKHAFVLPMISEGNIIGTISVHSTSETFSYEEMDLLQTLAKDLAFAIKSIELEKLKEKACQQIEQNIEQFTILIDRIRNPLAVIQALAELNLDEKTAKKIIEQVNRINEIIRKLDKGWMKSETIKNFLRKTEHASSRSL